MFQYCVVYVDSKCCEIVNFTPLSNTCLLTFLCQSIGRDEPDALQYKLLTTCYQNESSNVTNLATQTRHFWSKLTSRNFKKFQQKMNSHHSLV